MPKVLTQRANKDYPEQGIKKGDTYYKWSIRSGRGGQTFISAKPPRPSQLTQSKMTGAYAAAEAVEDVIAELRAKNEGVPYAIIFKALCDKVMQHEGADARDADGIEDARKVLAEELRTQAEEVTSVADEYQEAADNVGDGKLNSEEWTEKADALTQAADSMTSAADEIEDDEESTLEELLDKAQNAIELPCPLCGWRGIPILVSETLPPNVVAIVSRNEKDEVIDRKFIINVGGSDADRS